MIDWVSKLSEKQQAAVRRLAEARKPNVVFYAEKFADDMELDEDEFDLLVVLLEKEGHLEVRGGAKEQMLDAKKSIISVVHFLDNPPPTDWVNEWTTAIRTNKKAARITIVSIVISAIGGLISVVKTTTDLIDWFTKTAL